MNAGQSVSPTDCPEVGQVSAARFRSMRATMRVAGVSVCVMVDSGSSLSLVDEEFVRGLSGVTVSPWSQGAAYTLSGEPLQVAGGVALEISVGHRRFAVQMAVTRMRNQQVLLGNDALVAMSVVIDYRERRLVIPAERGEANKEAVVIPVSVDEESVEVSQVELGQRDSFEPDWDEVSWKEQLQPVAAVEETLRSAAEAAAGTPEEKVQLSSLLLANLDVFAANPKAPGTTSCVEHTIEIEEGVRPVYQRAYRVSQRELAQQDEEIDSMLEHGIIEASSSPWASPVVMVTKPDKSIRFCVDYRRLNSVTVKDRHGLPLIEDVLDGLGGNVYFTTLDLASGYWQVGIAEADRPKTAFTTARGLYQFRVMPFGLCNAPATFQRLMNQVLRGLVGKICKVYLDDVVIFSKTREEHLERLQMVLDRLRQHGLHLKASKCRFMQLKLKLLGFVISAAGVLPDPEKVEAVAQYPVPSNLKQLQRFLGKVGYYRRFIQDYSVKTWPLTRLTRKDAAWRWTEECQRAFEALKDVLVSAPIMGYPDVHQPFTLVTDASAYGMGAVLSQIQDGAEKVIAYASKTLNAAQRNYTAGEREYLAIVWAVQLYRHYLIDKKTTVWTDHQVLQYLQNLRDANGRLARWALLLQTYDLDIQYRPGSLNHVPDALSRAPLPATHEVNIIRDEREVRDKQLEDEEVRELMEYLEKDVVPAGASAERVVAAAGCHVVRDGRLYRVVTRDNKIKTTQEAQLRLVVPVGMRAEVLAMCHDAATSGHLGLDRTFTRLSERYYWKSMYADARNWILSCRVCSERKTPRSVPAGQLQPTVVERPWQRIGMDFVGPLPTSHAGNSYILMFVDYLTKYGIAVATPNHEAVTVAKALVNEVVLRYGSPEELLSDRGAEFRSVLVREMCRLFDEKKIYTTAYHPQTNGLVEHLNGTMKQMIAMYTNDAADDWDEYLQAVMFAYNTAKQESTGMTPYSLLFGVEARTPADIGHGVQLTDYGPERVMDWRERLILTLQQTRELATKRISAAQEKQKQRYDSTHKAAQYKVGAQVYLLKESRVKGDSTLRRRWRGPYTVQEQIGEQLYRVTDSAGKLRADPVNVQKMKPYTTRDEQLTTQEHSLHVPDVDEDEQEQQQLESTYEVERILQAKGKGKQRKYLVRWRGFDEADDTWEPKEHFQDPQMVLEYEREASGARGRAR